MLGFSGVGFWVTSVGNSIRFWFVLVITPVARRFPKNVYLDSSKMLGSLRSMFTFEQSIDEALAVFENTILV